MDGQIEYVWVVIRQVLNTVSVMDIIIENEYSLGTLSMDCMFGSDCTIVKETETLWIETFT